MFVSPVLDYSGRSVDLSVFGDLTPGGLITPSLYLPSGSGELIFGIRKLMQRFLLELLTISGSIPYLPECGTDFIADAVDGVWRTPGDVYSSFSSARATARTNLIADQLASDPDDERFSDAQLTSVAMASGSVILDIMLTAMSGDTLTVRYPLYF